MEHIGKKEEKVMLLVLSRTEQIYEIYDYSCKNAYLNCVKFEMREVHLKFYIYDIFVINQRIQFLLYHKKINDRIRRCIVSSQGPQYQ